MKAAPIFCYSYTPMQDVAPSAVRIADAIDAINCTINLVVSFLLIFTSFLFLPFYLFTFNLILGTVPKTDDCPQD